MNVLDLKNIPHALAIVGASENANFQMAKRLAKKLLCTTDKAECNCGPCERVKKEISESVLIIKPENELIRIDRAREILDFIKLAPINKANIVIIKNANLMNKDAANHLLKAIEETTKNQYFILTAPDESTLLSTIKSRLQIFRINKDIDKKDDVTKEKAEKLLEAIIHNNLIRMCDIKIKDKKETLLILYTLKEYLRDLAINYYNKSETNYPEIVNKFETVELKKINQIFDLTSKMIQHIKGNVDKDLALENLILATNC